MRGVVFLGDRTIGYADVPDPSPGPLDVIIEMKASGMCGTDLQNYRRPRDQPPYMPPLIDRAPIAGHEPAGVICAVGAAIPAEQARIGQRVMVHHYQGCTTCNHCRSGWQQLCQRVKPMVRVYGNNDDGGHAPYLKVPANTLVPLPDELSFEAGAAISCGTGTAYNALIRLNLSARHTVAIFGQGPVGLSATQLARAMNARVIALDVNSQRLQRAREFGAYALINPDKDDAVEALRELTHGVGVDCSLETSGVSSARVCAVRATKIWGVCCFVGEGGDVTINVSQDMIRRQMTIVASWTFSTVGQAECASFIAERGIDVGQIYTNRWPLDQAAEAYRLFDQGVGGKGVFVI
ncbi:MAG TPA: zinc-binding dehydrogenase [Bradyrhizobium sp.]|nr:zinc-binding dehydrogenase [Bradyrhizobium sp.]